MSSSDLKIAVIFEFFTLDGQMVDISHRQMPGVNDRLISCANGTQRFYVSEFYVEESTGQQILIFFK